MILALIKTVVKPLIPFLFNVGLECDIESIQRRFTKGLPGLHYLSYDERL